VIKAFYSDPHFYHHNIIKFCNRPFADVHEMNIELVARYNSVIDINDVVIWCGDVGFGSTNKTIEILKLMNGHKLLVRGNHDPKGVRKCVDMGFDIVVKEMFTAIAGRRCRISHYPYANNTCSHDRIDNRYLDRRPPKVKGEVLIHGHTHASEKIDGNMIHVGVDAWNWYPALYDEVEELVEGI